MAKIKKCGYNVAHKLTKLAEAVAATHKILFGNFSMIAELDKSMIFKL